jgi:hypothetical protein
VNHDYSNDLNQPHAPLIIMNLAIDLIFLIAANFLLYGWAIPGKPKTNLTGDDTVAADPGLAVLATLPVSLPLIK